MALDKQRILSELGNVMNQLKSADCGCMGKLFSNHGQSYAAIPNPPQANDGCRSGCCHGHGCGHGFGYSAPCAGEPFTAMNTHTTHQPCMGQCNPPELYANTYNYLNKNLMQPVVKEVYSDLKGITPGNTVMNNPMGNQIGLPMQGNSQGNMGNTVAHNQLGDGGMEQNMMQNNNMPASMKNQQMGLMGMGSMGPQIVNMMMRDGSSKPSSLEQGGQLTGPMIIDAPQSPHGKLGVTPLTSVRSNQGQYASHMQNATPQYMSQQNMYGGVSHGQHPGNINANNVTPDSQQTGNRNANPAAQQIAAGHSHPHGQHTQGIAKFNEMFPGVMQGLGGELNFDPMAIAIQMNPANHQNAAMNTMQKIMNGNGTDRVPGTPAVMPKLGDASAAANASQPYNPTQQNIISSSQLAQAAPVQQGVFNAGAVATHQNLIPQQQVSTVNQVPQQQVATSLSGAPTMNQQRMQPNQQLQYTTQYQQLPQQQPQTAQLQYQQDTFQQQQFTNKYQQQQQMIDPNSGAVVMPVTLPNVYNATEGSPNARNPPQPVATPEYAPPTEHQLIREPIYPVDTSKTQNPPRMKQQKYFEYNTLGQPVEMLPTKIYHTPEPNLPQTLSPQTVPTRLRPDPMVYSNVKSTVASLMGNRPVGKTPSRSQLQRVYNQYKGSQSYTQQNIRAPGQGATFSEGNLNVAHGNANQPRQVPLERIGGDTQANNQIINNQIQNKMDHVGDVPANIKPQGEVGDPLKTPPTQQTKCRNGLQDMIYTSYPTSAAWSFHGNFRPMPPPYRFRHRA